MLVFMQENNVNFQEKKTWTNTIFDNSDASAFSEGVRMNDANILP